MDWKLKTPSRNFTEFQQETIPGIDAVAGSSGIASQRAKGEFLVDLKLGQIGNSGDEQPDKWKELTVFKTVSSPSTSFKRARAANNGTLTVSCLVDGCNSDLSNCREYHRRHKVCELHSKTPEVTIGGQKRRFCQQCSRFHSLEEFDEVKRSCRKRLDGHNRRRRKPQPEPTLHSQSLLSKYQGAQFSSFSSPPLYPTNAVVSSTWPGVVRAKEETRIYDQHLHLQLLDKQNPFLGSSSSSYRGKQFTFLQADNPFLSSQAPSRASVRQAHLKTAASAASVEGGRKLFCDGLFNQVSDPHCALSLLSSPQAETSGISLSDMVAPNSVPIAQPLFPSLQCNSLEPMDSVFVANANAADVHCQGMFHIDSDGSSGNKAPQTLPFCWEW